MSIAMSKQREYYAELWERKGTRIWVEELARMYEIRSAIQRYAVSPPLRILDFGCGAGWLGQFLAKSGKVTAADFELSAIERARAEYPFVDFRLLDEKAPLYGLMLNSFDVVVSNSVLEHVADKRQHFNIIRDLLVRGGLLILTTPLGEVWPLWSKWTGAHYPPEERFQPIEAWISSVDLRKLLDDSGFAFLSWKRFYYMRMTDSISDRLMSTALVRYGYIHRLRCVGSMWRWLTDSYGVYQIIIGRKPS